MTRPIVIDVIGRDDTGPAMRSAADNQKKLAQQIDATNKSNDNLRKSQLGLIVAQERYNRVSKDTGASVGQLASAQKGLITAHQSVTRETKKLTDETEKFGNTAKTAGGKFSPLLDAALQFGPALVPIGAAAVAAGAGLAALGATGILAFKGIQKEMQQNTTLGLQYQAAFAPIVTEYGQLQHIAAAGVFDGVNRGIQAAKTLFPGVNTEVAKLSLHLGNIGGNLGSAFVNVFRNAEPLFTGLATQLDKGSGALLRWSQNSDGVQKFVAYAQKQLPVVEKIVENVAVTFGHIVQAAAPLGGVTLTAISNLSAAIAKIPVPVLTGLLVAFQASRLVAITSGFQALAGLFTGVGATAAGAATGVGLLAVATGLLADKVQGKIPQFGVNFQLLTSNLGKLNANYSQGVSAFGDAVEKSFEQGGAGAQKLALQAALATTQLGPVQTALMLTGQSTASFAEALTGTDSGWKLFLQNVRDGATAAGESKGAVQSLAGDLNLLRDQFLQGKLTGQQYADALKALGITAGTTTTQADLLKASLDRLNGVTLTAEAANITWWQSLQSVTGALATNGATTATNTKAGLDNRTQVLASVQAAEQQAIAATGATEATVANTTQYRNNIKVLLDHIATANGDKTATDRQNDATYQLVLTLSGYNRLPVPPKHPTVDTSQIPPAILKAQDDINSLHGKTVPVTIQWSGPGGAPGPAAAGFFGKAAGGPIIGPGTKTSDSVPIMASAGEFMMRADAVSKYGLGFMQNLNTMKYAQGGPIILQLPSGVAAHGEAIENALHPVWNIARPAVGGGVPGVSGPASASVAALQDYAFSLFRYYGWDQSQMSSLIALWNGESGWNPAAYNASSGATGIPQSLPASKMASAGADYLTNGNTQIRWGENYISQVYGSPSAAYSAWLSRSPHWYGGGLGPTVFTHPTMIGVGERGPETVSVTPGRFGGSGVVVAPGAITVYAAAGMDAKEVARQAFAELRRWVADEERRAAKGARA